MPRKSRWYHMRDMTEKDMNKLVVVGKSSDKFQAWLVSNPEDLYEKLTLLLKGLDLRDLAGIAIASAASNGNPEEFYRHIDTYINQRYPKYPRPPWAV